MKTIIGVGIMASILTYIFISTLFIAGTKPVVYATEEVEQERKVVLIRVETSDERITRKINAAFPDEPRMAKVAWCESRLKEDAIGPDGRDHGLFQIRDIHDTGELNMFDEDDNIAYAKTLYNKNGLGDWKASFHCWSK